LSFDLTGLVAYAAFFAVMALTNGLVCLGLNLQWGQTGLFNVGVAGFVAIGAYVSALLTTPPTDAHLGGFAAPFAVGWVGGAAAAAGASAAVGWLTLRLRADYLAIATFGVAFIPRPFDELSPTPALFNLANLALVAAIVAAVYIALERLTASPWGRVLRAIREDERAAVSLGKSPARYRLQAFSLGGALMGLAGAIEAHFIGFIAPENYASSLTFQVWAMLIVGGSGNNRGALLGAAVVWALWTLSGLAIGNLVPSDFEARAAALRLVLIGVLLATMIVVRPRGLIGERALVSRHISNRAAEP